ncbi:hypothetical protein EMIT0P176_230055 [Pseudomonas sp. IT-P176]
MKAPTSMSRPAPVAWWTRSMPMPAGAGITSSTTRAKPFPGKAMKIAAYRVATAAGGDLLLPRHNLSKLGTSSPRRTWISRQGNTELANLNPTFRGAGKCLRPVPG